MSERAAVLNHVRPPATPNGRNPGTDSEEFIVLLMKLNFTEKTDIRIRIFTGPSEALRWKHRSTGSGTVRTEKARLRGSESPSQGCGRRSNPVLNSQLKIDSLSGIVGSQASARSGIPRGEGLEYDVTQSAHLVLRVQLF
jgi:hypothetical protein